MPPLESMACGAPAIVCRNSSLPEVVGDAGIYVDANDATDMANAILMLHNPELRADLIARGLKQAAKFTFARTAQELAQALIETHDKLKSGHLARPSLAWEELRTFQKYCQSADMAVELGEMRPNDLASHASPKFTAGRKLEQALLTIASMQNSPFWKLRELTLKVLRQTGLRRRP
jgi:hypothetical protein